MTTSKTCRSKTERYPKTRDSSHLGRKEVAVHNITAELLPLMVPIDSIRQDPRNARQHNDRNMDTIKRSLVAYGQRKPVVVNHDGVIEAGNGLHEQARLLGWTHIAAVRVNDDGATATAFGVMDNQSALLADWDMPQLKDLLQELDTGDFDMDLTGFGAEEIEDLMTQYHFDPTQEWAGMPEYGQEDALGRRIVVHFATEDAVTEFARLVQQPIAEKTRYIWFPEQQRERRDMEFKVGT